MVKLTSRQIGLLDRLYSAHSGEPKGKDKVMEKPQGLYVVTDTAAEKDSPVFQESNDRTAKRVFAEMLKNVQYPGDFTLRRVGWIQDGVIIPDVEINLEDTINSEVEE